MCADKNKSFLTGATIGALLGAAAGLLFAPKSGEEIRKEIKEKAEKIKDETDKKFKEYSKESGQVVKEIESKLNPILNNLDEQTEPMRREFLERFNKFLDDFENTKKEAKKRFFKGTE